MKVLFVTYDFPYPTNSGGKMRAYNLIKQHNADIEMYLFSFVRNGFDKKSIAKVKDLGVKDVKFIRRGGRKSAKSLVGILSLKRSVFYGLYYNPVIAKLLLNYVVENNITVVHFESYYTAFYMSTALKELGIKQIFGTENIEASVYDDYIHYRVHPMLRPFYKFQNSKIKKEEESMFQMADSVLAVTAAEKKYIERFTKKDIHVIPNGVDLSLFPFTSKRSRKDKRVLFVGNFTYHPNIDAVEYFYNEVFYLLPQNYTFHIIGKNAKQLPFAGRERVVSHSYVDDIRKEYDDADVFVSPTRIGGGTNFKILESMAVGLPVVAFPHRLSELGVKHNSHVLVANTPLEFVAAIEKVTSDDAFRKKITANARSLIVTKYSWDVIGKEMNRVWKDLS